MLSSYVRDPKGTGWAVSLQLLPRRQGIGLRERFAVRLKKKSVFKHDGWVDFLPFPDGIDDIRIIIAILVLAVLLYFVGWPLLLLLADFLWLVLVLLGAFVSFVVLHRPVTIVASNGKQSYSWKVRGFFEAHSRKQDIIHQLVTGQPLKVHEN